MAPQFPLAARPLIRPIHGLHLELGVAVRWNESTTSSHTGANRYLGKTERKHGILGEK